MSNLKDSSALGDAMTLSARSQAIQIAVQFANCILPIVAEYIPQEVFDKLVDAIQSKVNALNHLTLSESNKLMQQYGLDGQS